MSSNHRNNICFSLRRLRRIPQKVDFLYNNFPKKSFFSTTTSQKKAIFRNFFQKIAPQNRQVNPRGGFNCSTVQLPLYQSLGHSGCMCAAGKKNKKNSTQPRQPFAQTHYMYVGVGYEHCFFPTLQVVGRNTQHLCRAGARGG